MLVLTLRGTPFVYQGEELGLTDAYVPADAIVDVDGRDPERSPMPWEPPSQAGPTAGFGEGSSWLPVHQDAERLAAQQQVGGSESFLELYRALIALRRSEPALTVGGYRSLEAAPDVFAYVREHEGRRIAAVLNFAPFPRPMPEEAAGGRLLLSTQGAATDAAQLAPEEGRLVAIDGGDRPER
jgi:alpha-glucosidase